eukprot:TRINITY_DN103351_c0_g1_i1.p1 TRINITY_DN103351_c0_g1~~TRINITY_DN103351_c0_g1_i1.p1  ORF type:complete len:145 (+),score=40.56 TRINITY_DN103351_c0_g1_i1:70-504(+)
MAFALERLHSAYSLEQAVVNEQAKVVCLRIASTDFDPQCLKLDEVLATSLSTVQTHCAIYAVDVREVPECAQQFQLSEALSLVFFFRGRPLYINLGSGQPKMAVSITFGHQQEFVDLVEACVRGAQQGRDTILAPKDYSLQGRY